MNRLQLARLGIWPSRPVRARAGRPPFARTAERRRSNPCSRALRSSVTSVILQLPTAPDWLADSVESGPAAGFGVYLHVPFSHDRWGYCDFATSAGGRAASR
jgi:hypothetical protein